MDFSVYTLSINISNYNKHYNIIRTRCETGDKMFSFSGGVTGSFSRPLSNVSSAKETQFSVLVE